MTLLEAFFLYVGLALLITQIYFVLPFLGFYFLFALLRSDPDLNPKNL